MKHFVTNGKILARQVRALEEKLRKSLQGVGEAHRSAAVAEDKHQISEQEQRRIDHVRAQDAAQRHANALVVAKELRESLPLHCAAVAGEARNRVRVDSASAQRQAAKARADIAREEEEAERLRQVARVRALESMHAPPWHTSCVLGIMLSQADLLWLLDKAVGSYELL